MSTLTPRYNLTEENEATYAPKTPEYKAEVVAYGDLFASQAVAEYYDDLKKGKYCEERWIDIGVLMAMDKVLSFYITVVEDECANAGEVELISHYIQDLAQSLVRAPISFETFHILQETGDYLLQETLDKLNWF